MRVPRSGVAPRGADLPEGPELLAQHRRERDSKDAGPLRARRTLASSSRCDRRVSNEVLASSGAGTQPAMASAVVVLAPAYAPWRPTETVLYGLVRQQHLEPFLGYARAQYDSGLPRYVEQELRASPLPAAGAGLPADDGASLLRRPAASARQEKRSARGPVATKGRVVDPPSRDRSSLLVRGSSRHRPLFLQARNVLSSARLKRPTALVTGSLAARILAVSLVAAVVAANPLDANASPPNLVSLAAVGNGRPVRVLLTTRSLAGGKHSLSACDDGTDVSILMNRVVAAGESFSFETPRECVCYQQGRGPFREVDLLPCSARHFMSV